MNYVILNGIKSTTVQGLLIQSLPPISKPLIRTSIEEIDGRDGDIVTKLGYSAYNKQMSIGLFGNYDVDEVIDFFDSEGTVIFSNEPDKFYYYQIIDQIDFEKLIRFKTAIVTFHVQPFKFSAVDDAFSVSTEEMSLRKYNAIKNGLTIKSENGVISIKGTPTTDTEFYVPTNRIILPAGSYSLTPHTSGTNVSSTKLRVIGNAPTDADSFAGQALQLSDQSATGLSMQSDETKTYNYVWLYINGGSAVDFTLSLELRNLSLKSCKVVNRGNIYSRPSFTIFGSGTIKLSINGVELFQIALASDGYITLDGKDMNAYKGDVLKNRQVQGDYSNLRLKTGTNTISWVGDVTDIKVENVSRWI